PPARAPPPPMRRARPAALRSFRSARHIAFYLANDGEIDPLPLMQRAWAAGKICYLPVLDNLHPQRLWFAPFRPGERMVYNRFNILEPDAPRRRGMSARRLNLVFAPLVAFDARGNRLGMGGGFYDRTLEFLPRRRVWRSPRVVGLAYEFQKTAHIARAAWDVPMQAIVTDARVYSI
ncbi:MAG: 5-formyltetrahydrofolate cyclo-ligase, partial [Pseudomonadota bacterium]